MGNSEKREEEKRKRSPGTQDDRQATGQEKKGGRHVPYRKKAGPSLGCSVQGPWGA